MNLKHTHEEMSRLATDIAYTGKVGSADVITVMEMLEQGSAAIKAREEARSRTTRSKLLYCMDYIMHHLSDDEAIVPWLEDGCPDGLFQRSGEPPAGQYDDLQMTDEEFDETVSVFARTLARQVMPALPDLCDYKSARKVVA